MKESTQPTVLSTLSTPGMICTSLQGVQTTNSKSWVDIDDAFFLQVQLADSTPLTVMAELALGWIYGGDSGKYTYFRIKVTGPGGSVGYAAAGTNKHASASQRPNLIRGFFQITGQAMDVYTFTPQWQVSGSTSTIDQPQDDVIANYLSVTAVSDQSGFVQGDGANT